jgi:hypothetical protein
VLARPKSALPEGVTLGAAGPRAKRMQWLVILVAIAWPLWPFYIPQLAPRATFLILLGLLVVLGIVVFGLAEWARVRDRKEVESLGFKACLRCRYPLDTFPAEGVCPECGSAYRHEQLVRSWKWTYDRA